jgi:Mrp family chromosome partitioning ATPase
MSRNFELMRQLEVEVCPPGRPAAITPERAAPVAVVPVIPGHTSNIGDEEMLRFVQRVFLSTSGTAPRQVVLCGVEDENGSSSVCASAGRTLAANTSRSVCLVDANVRSPRLSGMFGFRRTTPRSGSSALLRERCSRIGGNLWLAEPDILADSGRLLLPANELKRRLALLRSEFEYMLIDAPGTSAGGDAQLLGQVADAAVLIIEANSTRRRAARKAKEALNSKGVRVLGTVLNSRSFPIPEWLYKRL